MRCSRRRGVFAERFDSYEDRPGQRDMLRTVVDRFNEGGVAIVEAGTGTGKSLAYLLPAARWAQENGERTVLSTNTINLQEQLAGKDLPLVRSLTGEVRWALVKGRGNYVSIRRALLAAEAQTSLFDDDRSEQMRALLEWIGTTDDGSLSDLPFTPESETWEEVRSDPDICMRSRCPHFQQCFLSAVTPPGRVRPAAGREPSPPVHRPRGAERHAELHAVRRASRVQPGDIGRGA